MIDKSTRKQLAERKERVRRRINTKVDPENYEFNTLWELNTPEQQCDIVRVGGVIPQLDIVHKPSDHGGIGGTADWKRTSKAAECVIDRLISR